MYFTTVDSSIEPAYEFGARAQARPAEMPGDEINLSILFLRIISGNWNGNGRVKVDRAVVKEPRAGRGRLDWPRSAEWHSAIQQAGSLRYKVPRLTTDRLRRTISFNFKPWKNLNVFGT